MSSECQSELPFRNGISGVKHIRAFQKQYESEFSFAIHLTEEGKR